jgi:hypothetical protein
VSQVSILSPPAKRLNWTAPPQLSRVVQIPTLPFSALNGVTPCMTRAFRASPMTSSTSEGKVTPESGPVSGEDLAHNATTSRQAKPKRRNRVILSCLECRRRKMKCDREVPSIVTILHIYSLTRNRNPARPVAHQGLNASTSRTRKTGMPRFVSNWSR